MTRSSGACSVILELRRVRRSTSAHPRTTVRRSGVAASDRSPERWPNSWLPVARGIRRKEGQFNPDQGGRHPVHSLIPTSCAPITSFRPPQKKKARVNLAFAERETGLEPATSTLARWHSTTELLPQIFACTVFRRRPSGRQHRAYETRNISTRQEGGRAALHAQSPRLMPRSRAVWTVSESRGTVLVTAMASSMGTGTMWGGW